MPAKDLRSIASRSPYPLEAFLFVQRGLDYTVRQAHGEPEEVEAENEDRHVDGRQLCQGLRDFAVREYGLLARTVLRRWRIQSSEDFGRIVFLMVDAGFMHKTSDDTLEDFMGIYDIDTAFSPQLSLTENA
ncbi:MAG: Minf_1886 family protein [Phycisphaeraceae bacterium]